MRSRTLIKFALALAALAVFSPSLRADEVLLKNGDHITGTVTAVEGSKLKIKSDLAGEITVDLGNVQTFTTTEPLRVKLKDNSILKDKITTTQAIPGAPTTQPTPQIAVAGKQIPPTELKKIYQPSKWTGSILANGNIARGNTHSEDFGLAADASLRRDDDTFNDRFSLAAAYNFGKQKVNGVDTTSADNWFGQAKYDKFFDEKLYGYGVFRVDHDRLAFLNYRLSPGVGVGYQWYETPTFNFLTEAGISYVYEDYSNDGSDDRVAVRFAYHVDKSLNDKVSVFHNLEWLPAINDPSDYNLNADIGLKAKMTDHWFSEFKFQWQRDSTPAPGALENDTRFVIGIGWTF